MIEPAPDRLLPVPKQAEVRAGFCSLADGLHYAGDHSPGKPALAALNRELEAIGAGMDGTDAPVLTCHRAEVPGKTGAYRLSIQTDAVTITAADTVGWCYGTHTLIQWIRLHRFAGEDRVGCLEVIDTPDFEHRGVMLDISRTRVPTMDTLFAWIDLFASLKLNQLQLYTEHTFAYRNHNIVWRGCDPITHDQLKELDVYCIERHIELVANQNSFGHFHRWLVHAPYRSLAEVPEGVEHPFAPEKEPFSLCPEDPGTLKLLAGLYDELLPCVQSNTVNVGMDETFDLGMGRSRERCEVLGKTRVYLEFVKKVHALLAQRGKRMMFWGDIIIHHPELIAELPKDIIPLEWGYEADHPFAEHGRLFAQSGLAFYVCPGTSSWQSITGRGRNMVDNLARAATAGRNHGAAGYLITDWGDWGYLQPPPVAYAGFAVGAGYAWRTDAADRADDLDVPALLDLYVFNDRARALGQTVWDLSNLYRLEREHPTNGSCLFYLLRFADKTMNHERLRGLDRETLTAMREELSRLKGQLEDVRSRTADYFRFAADLSDRLAQLAELWLSVDRDQPLIAVDPEKRRALSAALTPLIQTHENLWQDYSRPGGLAESRARLMRLQHLLD
ncbi:MAG: family 20 glycosylhydrolase [Acidobacteriota bacterium]|nr:family 20 glycosylhydrolase [Acidobacteriota bacterium]